MRNLLAALALAAPFFPFSQAAADPHGTSSHWASAAKTAAGTAYERYTDGRYAEGGKSGHISRVWFSSANGMLTEMSWGLIHEAQVRDLKFLISGGGWTAEEGRDTVARTEYLSEADGRPQSLAYKITTADKGGRFEIEKRIFTDPDRDTIMVRVTVKALKGPLKATFRLNPHMANTAGGDALSASADSLTASEDRAYLSVRADRPFQDASSQDGLLSASLPVPGKELTFDLVLGFGPDAASADKAALGTLKEGYDRVLAAYNAGWAGYLKSLAALPGLVASTADNGRLLYVSAMILKAHEDKTNAGALVASLSNPWGEAVDARKPQTGYKAVWPRDFYQCAMALLALGDRETPLAALRYLPRIQARAGFPGYEGAPGWFMQKSAVDGVPEWVAVQLDQTAMPVMLAGRLHDLGILSKEELAADYARWIKPAANFLADGGDVNIQWNRTRIVPPFTQQERWEEQAGVSASTTAAVIAGLATASRIASLSGDRDGAARYLAAAHTDEAKIDPALFTATGPFGDGHYYIRISPDGDANSGAKLETRNTKPGVDARAVMDGGFLELVRYGIRKADDPRIAATVKTIDLPLANDNLRVRYDFKFGDKLYPGWRRYGNDGYGEDLAHGGPYLPDLPKTGDSLRGRVWPLLTGERGHYALALALSGAADGRPVSFNSIRDVHVRAMELFANEGSMIPEQVWDGVGNSDSRRLRPGEGTGSATPLAWAHAEYVKLVRSVHDGRIWDQDPAVAAEFAGRKN